MCTRGVWQLQGLRLRYCAHGGSSTGVRDFIVNRLSGVAKEWDESVFIRAQVFRGQHPIVTGKYRDGTTKTIDLKNKSAAEVAAVLRDLRDTSTGRYTTGRREFFRRPVVSAAPSVQGPWDPGAMFDAFTLRSPKAPAQVAPSAAAASAALPTRNPS